MKTTKLQDKLIRMIDEVVDSIDNTDYREVTVKETDKYQSVEILYNGDRGGDNFFTPRVDEEDDDFPNFIGGHKIEKRLKKYLGSQCSVSAWDHEKGLFSVMVTVPKLNVDSK